MLDPCGRLQRGKKLECRLGLIRPRGSTGGSCPTTLSSYSPLRVGVGIAVFSALGFAFYVFFVPFVGAKHFQIVAMAIYAPLITCVVVLHIWFAATNPGDPCIFSSAKHLKLDSHRGRPLGEATDDSNEKLRGRIHLLAPDFLEYFAWFVSHSLAFASDASIPIINLQNRTYVKKACFSAAYAKLRCMVAP
ncbi:uncharacterized protein LOC120678650 isoform X2 [Panicum virgatum]|uniref:uncharacterized protein LOC120678650 isoform X2 n=1 Tax=Panicum virgatum TaxID=38727 RepID=UPI0019D5FFE6|nr:uncharacterized protein LOC120678650 isoform X2 [Panicum virgatum]